MGIMNVGTSPKLRYRYLVGGTANSSVTYSCLSSRGDYTGADGVTAYNLAVAINAATTNTFAGADISAVTPLQGE